MDKDKFEVEELHKILIDPNDASLTTFIGARLPDDIWEKLISNLKKHKIDFSCSHANISGINPEIMMHKLKVDLETKP